MTLDELKVKYPRHTRMKYEPKSDCKWCKGSGEAISISGIRPCICTYVDHQVAELAQEWFNQVGRELGYLPATQ